jgi:hypothetical protein
MRHDHLERDGNVRIVWVFDIISESLREGGVKIYFTLFDELHERH